ncbi:MULTISPECIES: DUF3800 domain-containing protein [Pectobacterium]|uniref:DUF3800 domain-containing protein n=1 Tax=Pectobacterium TaxID=122277 RepID=UPI0025A11954|nr:DUF3800 domain-containing protein [Pectobacterium brasiliense]WJM80310.1 DUF3800 domain-containing protein [Pectobacterium brasiliense]
MMVKNLYLDESGNSGDLISRKNGLGFAGQPVFSLAAIDISRFENIESRINDLKNKFGIRAVELKSSDIFKKKPRFMLEVFSILVDSKCPFFIEVVDKKYYISTSISNHQLLPPYFTGDESDGRFQISRNIASGVMALEMPDEYFERFFDSCHEPSEENILRSMVGIKEFFEGHPEYSGYAKNLDMSIEDYFDVKKDIGDNAVFKFIPIPDDGKRGNKILLLPHVSSLTNIIARVNLANKGSIAGVTFFHDKQDHFDEVLFSIKELMVSNNPNEFSPPTPNSNFQVKTSADLQFSDSKKSLGVQMADLLAGFFSRYYEGFCNSEAEFDGIYHEIYNKIIDGSDQEKSIGVNWVVPPSRLYEIEYFHHFGKRKNPSPTDLLCYVAKDFGVVIED